eukprot:CAMPEP_0119333988 /NCGR_PEP_ID=MMETSP1333-20130426/86398_1 /TAXON_ID=418940 /ORGANISM="Scyphosphaera apsteinii, Strain RCC1455" /LENGTH=368 /DNA_ID=CAMNT_0007344191 /DNA_START=123 /DNA_END=1230 /DNA_ORIENTATION=+
MQKSASAGTQASEQLKKTELEEEIEAAAAAEAAGKIARSPTVLKASHEVAKQAVDALQAELAAASSEHAIAKVLASKGATGAVSKLARALRKPKGTIALIGAGSLMDSATLGGFDLNDPGYISEQFRLAGASAVCVALSGDDMLTADALATTAAEQATAAGEFPGPLPIIARDCFVDEVQLAAAKAGGATAVLLTMVYNGEEKTRSLLKEATQLGLEPIVRVATETELSWALEIGSKIICIGDTSLPCAQHLLAKIPSDVVSLCDIQVKDVRGVWKVRDLGFDALIIGKSLMEICIRDRIPPESVMKAMLSKGSVQFGLGMQKGRLEGSKETLGSQQCDIPMMLVGAVLGSSITPTLYLAAADLGMQN